MDLPKTILSHYLKDMFCLFTECVQETFQPRKQMESSKPRNKGRVLLVETAEKELIEQKLTSIGNNSLRGRANLLPFSGLRIRPPRNITCSIIIVTFI